MAQTPGLLNYQGRVVANGTNFTGTGQFKFALVDGSGSRTFWSNDGTAAGEPTTAVSIAVNKGLYSVLLGQSPMVPVSPAVFTNADVRLRVWFDGGSGMQRLIPDQRIGAVGYALMAATVPDGAIDSTKLASDAASLAKVSGGALSASGANIGIGTTDPQSRLDLGASVGAKLRLYEDGGVDNKVGFGIDMSPNPGYEGSLYFGANPQGHLSIGTWDGTNFSEKLRVNSGGKVGIGMADPAEGLEVAGRLVIGDSTNASPKAGTIRWTGADFQGFNGSQWLSLTMPTPAGMVLVPGGTLVTLYSETNTVVSFNLSKYEVTYGLWWNVRQWALTNGFHFQNQGREGSQGTNGSPPTEAQMLPVTDISWRDAIVWCNARSVKEGLQPAYTYDGAVIQDARDANAAACDGAVLGSTSDGYRLPKSAEWEYAARYVDVGTSIPGMWASGATNATSDAAACNEVAWFQDNSGNQTHPVGQKRPNHAGICDMSGNVDEWCWEELLPGYRCHRGRDFHEIAWNLFVGGQGGQAPYTHSSRGGLRCARNAR